MPVPVNARPSPSTLLSCRAGAPCSSAHGRRRAQTLNFLRAYALPHLAEARFNPYSVATSSRVYALYRRTPGVQVVQLTIALHATQDGGSAKSAVLEVEAGTNLSGLSPVAFLSQNASFGGVESVFLPSRKARLRDELVGFVDVSGFDPADLIAFRITYTPSATGEMNGIARVSLSEVPLATVDPTSAPTTEPGVNEAEPDVRNRIHQGTTTSRTGLLRLFAQLDLARSAVRGHLQIIAPHDHPISRDSLSLGPLDWGGAIGTSWDARFRLRARRLYAAGTPQRCTLAAIYSYSATYPSGLANAFIRATATTIGLGGATASTADLPLAHTGASYAIGTTTFDVPTDGTDQRVELSFAARTESTDGFSIAHDPLSIVALALIDDEL